MDEGWDRTLFVRDRALTGDPYKVNVSGYCFCLPHHRDFCLPQSNDAQV